MKPLKSNQPNSGPNAGPDAALVKSDNHPQSDQSANSSLMAQLEQTAIAEQTKEKIQLPKKQPEQAVMPASEKSSRNVPKKIIVKKYGILHAIFQPLSIAAAMLIGTYLTISMAMNYWHGYQRDIDYSKTRHIDTSSIKFFQNSLISKDKVELIIRNFDGQLEKRAASKSQLSEYLKSQAVILDQAKKDADANIKAELALIFAKAFKDKEAAIDAYADWFFEWKRPYVILKEAISSTTSRLIKLGEYESLRTAIERDMADYFMAQYNNQVLKPEERDAIITAGIEKIARQQHQNYLTIMAGQDAAMREFLMKNTTFLNAVPADKPLTKTTLDWDAQRWKNPTYLMEDRAFDGIAGLGTIAAGGTIGALAIGPAVNRGISGIFTPLARRFATSMGARITLAEGGAAAGTLVEPVGGTIVGAAIGVVLGFAADYVANKLNEKFSREKFIDANNQALDNTINLWQDKMNNNLNANVGKWYDDAKAGLLLVRPAIASEKETSDKLNKQPDQPLM